MTQFFSRLYFGDGRVPCSLHYVFDVIIMRTDVLSLRISSRLSRKCTVFAYMLVELVDKNVSFDIPMRILVMDIFAF